MKPALPLVPGSASMLRNPAPSDHEDAASIFKERIKTTAIAQRAQPARFINDNKTDAPALSMLVGGQAINSAVQSSIYQNECTTFFAESICQSFLKPTRSTCPSSNVTFAPLL